MEVDPSGRGTLTTEQPASVETDTGADGANANAGRADLAIAAALLPLLILAGIFGYRAMADQGPGFECTSEHQALGHC